MNMVLDPEETGGAVLDFAGKVDGGGVKLSLTDSKKVPMELIPACVLELAAKPGTRSHPCIQWLNSWAEGEYEYVDTPDDYLLRAWDALRDHVGMAKLYHGVAQVLAFGAKKYAADNWRRGLPWRSLVGAINRHYYLGIVTGEENDPETGLSHWFHIGCCMAFLIEYTTHRELYAQFDNRFIRPEAA